MPTLRAVLSGPGNASLPPIVDRPTDGRMITRSKAPLRISFCGGGTDVPPYPAEHGGAVLNATINKYAYVSGFLRPDRTLAVQSLDYDLALRYRLGRRLRYDGRLDLVKAAVHKMSFADGVHLFMHNDAPPGSGLGSSSAVVVAVVAMLCHLSHRRMTDYELARLAYEIERVELDIKGGLQDQYAATFGGFNFMEFTANGVVVNPLRIRPEIVRELEYHLLLCHTGKIRPSARIIETQTAAYVRRETAVVSALHCLKQIAIAMKESLLHGRLMDFGLLLNEGWQAKKALTRRITDRAVDALYEAALASGAVGGKLLGAGGGGHLLVFAPFHRRRRVADVLERLGGHLVPFAFEPHGVVTWEAENYLRLDARGRAADAALSERPLITAARGRVV